MNCYSYNEAHGISFHSDYSSAYDARDPITSLSMVNGSLLIISAKSGKKKLKCKWALLLYQPVNSMLIMGGHFQSQFLHAVPTYNEMLELVKHDSGAEVKLFQDQPMLKIFWSADSRNRMLAELNRLKTLNLGDKKNHRWNVTMRWCRRHESLSCPEAQKENEELQGKLASMRSASTQSTATSSDTGNADPTRAPAWDAKAAKESEERSAQVSKVRKMWDPNIAEISARQLNAPPKPENPETAVEQTQKNQLLVVMERMVAMIIPESFQRAAALFTGHTSARKNRHAELQRIALQLSQLDSLLKNLVDTSTLTLLEAESLQTSVLDKYNSLRRQQVLLELLWLDAEAPGFLSCSEHVSADPKKYWRHLTKVTMTFDSFKQLLKTDPLAEKQLANDGWLCFDFSNFHEDVLVGDEKDVKRTRIEGLWYLEFWDVYGLFDPQPRGPPRMTLRMSLVSSALQSLIQKEMKAVKSNSMSPRQRFQQWFSLWLDHVETREHRSLHGDIKPKCQIVLWMILESEKRHFINLRKERGEQKMNADASWQGDWDVDWQQDWQEDWQTNRKAHQQSSWYEHSTGAASSWQKKKKRGKA